MLFFIVCGGHGRAGGHPPGVFHGNDPGTAGGAFGLVLEVEANNARDGVDIEELPELPIKHRDLAGNRWIIQPIDGLGGAPGRSYNSSGSGCRRRDSAGISL